MPMNKIQDVKLETTANYQPLSDLNVRFWNQDKNTAELRFIITRNQFPLSLSKENVKVIIALESGSSFISSDDFIIDSEVEGVARYIIPNDFMRLASNVVGQVYVTTLDGEEVIVERQFKFTVSNDLLNDYPSEDKLRYIKTFDDLRTEVSSRITKLEEDLSNMEDYVTKVEDTTNSGVSQLNNLIKSKQETLENDYNDKINTINTKGQEYSTTFDGYKEDMDKKKSDFDNAVMESGLVTTGDANNWQKVKLTSDTGIRTYISKTKLTDITALDTGFYETVPLDNSIEQGLPQETAGSFVEIDVMKSDAGRMQFKVVKSYDGRTFLRTIHTGGDRDTGWKEVPLLEDISTLETSSGSEQKANIAENNARQYTNKIASQTNEVIFRGSAKGVGSTIALNKPYTDYDELKIFTYGHGASECYVRDTDPSKKIIMYSFNLTDSDASNGDIVETQIERTNSTSFKIVSVSSYNLPTNSGTINSSLGLDIYKIVGVRYYANLNQQ